MQRSDVGLNDVARRKWLQPSEDNVFYYTPEKKQRESSSPVMKAHSEYFDVDRGTIDALAAVKSGDVVGMGAWEEKGIGGVARNKTAARRSERSTQQQQRIVKLEQRLADLNADKNQARETFLRLSLSLFYRFVFLLASFRLSIFCLDFRRGESRFVKLKKKRCVPLWW